MICNVWYIIPTKHISNNTTLVHIKLLINLSVSLLLWIFLFLSVNFLAYSFLFWELSLNFLPFLMSLLQRSLCTSFQSSIWHSTPQYQRLLHPEHLWTDPFMWQKSQLKTKSGLSSSNSMVSLRSVRLLWNKQKSFVLHLRQQIPGHPAACRRESSLSSSSWSCLGSSQQRMPSCRTW